VLAVELNYILILFVVEDKYIGCLRTLTVTILTTYSSVFGIVGICLGDSGSNLVRAVSRTLYLSTGCYRGYYGVGGSSYSSLLNY
jgi:hypothetical protein